MIRTILASLLALPLLLACASTPEGEWVEAEVAAASERVLWQVATLSMERNGWTPSAQQDRAHGRAESTWRVELQPFKGEGRRDRCHVEVRPGTAGRWMLRVRVEVETNEELARPLDITQAQWAPAGDDALAAKRVLMHAQALLRAPPAPGS